MMGLDKKQFRQIVRTVLNAINLYSPDAEELLLGTAAQESQFGTFLTQSGGGPGRGVFQMEEATEEDIWKNYLRYHSDVRDKLRAISGVVVSSPWQMMVNLAYQIAMARFKYFMCPGAIPLAADLPAQAEYYKQYWNTAEGAATVEEYLDNYKRYVG